MDVEMLACRDVDRLSVDDRVQRPLDYLEMLVMVRVVVRGRLRRRGTSWESKVR